MRDRALVTPAVSSVLPPPARRNRTTVCTEITIPPPCLVCRASTVRPRRVLSLRFTKLRDWLREWLLARLTQDGEDIDHPQILRHQAERDDQAEENGGCPSRSAKIDDPNPRKGPQRRNGEHEV